MAVPMPRNSVEPVLQNQCLTCSPWAYLCVHIHLSRYMAAQAAECLETNVWCIAKVIFGVQNMKITAQHAQLSNTDITSRELTPTWAVGPQGLFPPKVVGFGHKSLRELFKGKFKKSGFKKRAFKDFLTDIWLFISTSAILVIRLNVYLKRPLVLTFSVSEISLA